MAWFKKKEDTSSDLPVRYSPDHHGWVMENGVAVPAVVRSAGEMIRSTAAALAAQGATSVELKTVERWTHTTIDEHTTTQTITRR